MGAVNCCAQTSPDGDMSSLRSGDAPSDSFHILGTAVDAWKTGNRYRTLSRGEARVLMPMYDYEPSLSLDHEDRASSPNDGVSGYLDTPQSISSGQELEFKAEMVVSTDGNVEIQDRREEKESPPSDNEELDELSSEARALLPAPNSCPRSGMNLRRQSPTFGSSKSQTLELRCTQSFDKVPMQPRLDDYLCACKYCPRAMTIQRAFQLYGFALDHPQSDALLRVLRACANYDETIMEVDPLLVLHAEKMLEELGFDEDQTFCLLVASHFQRP